MAFRLAVQRATCVAPRSKSVAIPGSLSRHFTAGVGASSLQQNETQTNKKLSLPNPDPASNSATAAFVNERAPYMVPTYVRPLPVMSKGEGCYLWDMENRRYLDLTAGIAVTSLGHSDPDVTKVIAEQASILLHASNLYHNNWTGNLSKLLVTQTLESGAMRGATQAFISNSGTEANEAAIKFARKVGHSLDPSGAKHEFVSFHNSFHGRTFGALSATPNPKYQAPFAPMVPGFKYGRYNDTQQLSSLITEKTCGVIVEPIQGEGGVNTATPEFLVALRARCDEVGAVLIFDEIQCGLSRTGSLWAHAHPSLVPTSGNAAHPDILTTAKALGNGFPIGATIISDVVGKHIKTGDHGTTFGGNPLACCVAHHVLTRLASRELQDTVAKRSKTFVAGLESLRESFPGVIAEIRGRGLIIGVQLSDQYSSRVGDVVTAARQRGVLIITAGEGCLRFVPPLVISEEQIREGLRIVGNAMEDAFKA
ncbi:acetylornithine aminotransferase [Ophidiomyces ophidiicola]|uniref:Acetylornithine aminotransferase n=1 Tax=Ophidiomyces ophidiicola TaxID=1387563 RepID=A0ACB8UZV2_9EURO|nr:acetylornithine aminotransferase [Ophidiomyces ophidiicola]KAI1927013.1 acetylornithine aminotransferase [Ophidiomyces ophidiicola]KAI1929184.1 acetylornithine aminotransferase [Ophidiomyces ophidiicola]KAI1963607.1 acetylornithine aminotransferase [Ophidiomyces ophidiicola]KAI1974072.1 acetylornithine aminotransferase [Ophidiomyces ophidiicola]